MYDKLLVLRPDAPQLHVQLGINLMRINDNKGAIKAFNRALELAPRLDRARLLLGMLYLESGRYFESVAHLRLYLRRRPDDSAAAETMAGALGRLGRFKEAAEIYTILLRRPAPTPGQHLAAMYIALRAGAPEAAEQLAPPEGAPYLGTLLRALARQDKDEPHEPLLDSLDAFDEGDLDNECSEYLSRLLGAFGDEEAGEWLLERLSAFAEAGVRSRTLGIIEGRLMLNMERYEEAVDALREVLKSYETDHWVHYYLAVSYEELDNFEATETHLRAFLEAEPKDAEVLNFLAYLYAEYGINLDEAEEMLNQALDAEPENPFFQDSLGWVFYKKGKAKRAIDLIRSAIAGMDFDDAVLRDHLGDAYLLKGDTERAIAEWERAHRLDADLEGVAEKLEKHR